MGGGRPPGPVCYEDNYTPLDANFTCEDDTSTLGPLQVSPEEQYLRSLFDDLAALARNFGQSFIKDAKARANYVRKIQEMSDQILRDVRSGTATAGEGAVFAQEMRNAIMAEARAQSSMIGRASAEALKKSGKTLSVLIEEKAAKMFGGRSFATLAKAERQAVFEGIIESAGHSRPSVTAMIPRWRMVGRGCLLFTVAIAVYNVWTAENKVKAGLSEAIIFGGGAAGGALAGAATGLVCGPAAPFCSTALFVVGGIMGAMAAQAGTVIFDEELREMAEWMGEVW